MTDRLSGLDSLYRLLAELEKIVGGKRKLSGCTGRMGWPKRGVYFFFESGELREDARTPRVVRVGTHALRPSKSTLWGRLSQHKGISAGSTPGGGNHRGSIFRLHVGSALLSSGDWPPSIGENWARGQTATREIRLAEYPVERAVTECIGAMPFLWVEVDDPPSANSDRGVIEAGSIALLSNRGRGEIDGPSPGWLGRHADRQLVRESGLWNVNHVRDAGNNAFLEILERHIYLMRT